MLTTVGYYCCVQFNSQPARVIPRAEHVDTQRLAAARAIQNPPELLSIQQREIIGPWSYAE